MLQSRGKAAGKPLMSLCNRVEPKGRMFLIEILRNVRFDIADKVAGPHQFVDREQHSIDLVVRLTTDAVSK